MVLLLWAFREGNSTGGASLDIVWRLQFALVGIVSFGLLVYRLKYQTESVLFDAPPPVPLLPTAADVLDTNTSSSSAHPDLIRLASLSGLGSIPPTIREVSESTLETATSYGYTSTVTLSPARHTEALLDARSSLNGGVNERRGTGPASQSSHTTAASGSASSRAAGVHGVTFLKRVFIKHYWHRLLGVSAVWFAWDFAFYGKHATWISCALRSHVQVEVCRDSALSPDLSL